MTLRTHHTPGCDGDETDWLRVNDRNRRIGTGEFRYLRCQRCGLIRLDNVPANLGDYYPSDYYQLPTLAQLADSVTVDSCKIETVRRFVKRGRLLEIGSAYGAFAFQAKQAGFKVDVIEMDARCCDYLQRVVGVNALCSASPHEAISALGRYDVIALWHVIEHLPSPWALLSEAAKSLGPDGILVLAAPNPDAWQFSVMGKEWPHLDAPRHLYLIPAQILTEYAQTLGLQRIYYTTTDTDAKHWNRFGWQRLLMNRVRGKWLERAAFVAGYALSLFVSPFEARQPKGSAYTIAFRKSAG